MPAVSSVTVKTVRRGASGSSSNGNSNGELMLDFLCRQTQAPHRRRLSGGLIGSNQNAVQPRIAAGRFHSGGHTTKKFIKDRGFFNTDNAVVRARHSRIGE